MQNIPLSEKDDSIVKIVMARYIDRRESRIKVLERYINETNDEITEFSTQLVRDFDKSIVEIGCTKMGIQSVVKDVRTVFEDDIKGAHYVVTLGLIDTDLLIKGGHGIPQIFKLRHINMSSDNATKYQDLQKIIYDFEKDIAVIEDELDHSTLEMMEDRAYNNLNRYRLVDEGFGDYVNTDILLEQ
jgi:hypothetical protein